MIADDHALVRRGLCMLLERAEGVDVAGEAGDGDRALALAKKAKPDVLLLDINMPGQPSLELIAELAEQVPEVAVVVLTMEQDPGIARRALDRGARGYLVKQVAEDELIEAIRTAAAGGRYVSRQMQVEINRSQREDEMSSLSERELEVLRLVALGHTNPEIGERLGISVRTVESHRVHISQKTGLHLRRELVQLAIKHRLI